MSVPLKDICELIVDCPHSTAPDEGAGYPIIRTPNVGPGYLLLDGVQRVSEETYNKRNIRAVPRNGDLILAREAPAGNVGIINTEEKVCLGQRTVLIRPDATKADPWYLNFYLNAPEQRHALLKSANGATVSHVNMPIIRNLPVQIPALEEQRRIAGILSAYDELIENNRKQIKLLEEAAQRLYKEWFIDLRFPGCETSSINPDTGLPEGWRKEKICACSESMLGGTPSKSNNEYWTHGTVPWINSGEINNDFIVAPSALITQSAVSESATKLIAKYSTMVAITGATMGQVSMNLIDTCTNQSVVSITPYELNMRAYLYCYVTNNIGIMVGRATGGAQQHFNKEVVVSTPIVLPDAVTLNKFDAAVMPFIHVIEVLSFQILDLREARDRLLPKLMSGEIEV